MNILTTINITALESELDELYVWLSAVRIAAAKTFNPNSMVIDLHVPEGTVLDIPESPTICRVHYVKGTPTKDDLRRECFLHAVIPTAHNAIISELHVIPMLHFAAFAECALSPLSHGACDIKVEGELSIDGEKLYKHHKSVNENYCKNDLMFFRPILMGVRLADANMWNLREELSKSDCFTDDLNRVVPPQTNLRKKLLLSSNIYTDSAVPSNGIKKIRRFNNGHSGMFSFPTSALPWTALDEGDVNLTKLQPYVRYANATFYCVERLSKEFVYNVMVKAAHYSQYDDPEKRELLPVDLHKLAISDKATPESVYNLILTMRGLNS